MPVPVGTFSVARSVGNREDLQDKIYMISPSDTPGVSSIGVGSADAVLHEWQTDTLAAPDANNAQLEGDDPTIGLAAPTVRVQNNCQILRKEYAVSGTQQEIKKAGREDEMSYQIAKRGKELKRDMERIFMGSQQRNPGAADANGYQTTARRARGLEHFITSNVSYGATGANPANDTTALTDGTLRNITEALFLDVLQSAFINGGEPSLAILGPATKRTASGFAGRAGQQIQVAKKAVEQSITLYDSDFGVVKMVAGRYHRTRTTLLIDPEYASIAYLRRIKRVPLAKTGDSEKGMLIGEATLVCGNEAAHGKVADLN